MMHCPQGHGLLERAGVAGAFVWVCRQCRGRAVTMPVLRRQVDPAFTRELWSAATTAGATGVTCPSCLQQTAAVHASAAGERIELDVCPQCACVWFDAGEHEQCPELPASTPAPAPDLQAVQARQRAAIAEVTEMARRSREEQEAEPSLHVSRLPALLGLPVELGASHAASLPWVTWTTAAAIVVTSVVAFFDPAVVQTFALVPARIGDSFGLTLLTAFFVHAGWLHLLGNLWFLVVFGNGVEQRFGRARWLAIVASATLVGALAHVFVDVRSHVPCVGASGGISGLIVCYAMAAPEARLGTWLWVGPRPFWLTFRARTGLIVWLLLQVWLLVKQLAGIGNVSATAHLGGVAAGFAAWWYWRSELRPPGAAGAGSEPKR